MAAVHFYCNWTIGSMLTREVQIMVTVDWHEWCE